MKSQSAPRSHFSLWYAILGFFLGLLVIAAATVIAALGTRQPLTLDSLIRVNLGNPLLWLIDTAVISLAVMLGLIGRHKDRLFEAQSYHRLATQKHSTEIESLSAQVADLEKRGQELEGSLHARTDENIKLQAELDDLEQKSLEIETVISRGKKQWEATFDSVQDMIILTALDGSIARCNRATSEKFGLGFNDLIGRQFRDLVREEGAAAEAFPLPRQPAEIKIAGLEGWYEVTSSLVDLDVDAPGKIYVVRDVTERKQAALNLQFQKQYYESLVKNSPTAIVTLKMDHTIVECNPAFEKLFGYSALEALGKELDSLVAPAELVEEARRYTEAVSSGEMVHEFSRRRRKDGSSVDVELFGIPVTVRGKQIGVLALYHDISNLVRPPEKPAVAPEKLAQPPEELVHAPVEEVQASYPEGVAQSPEGVTPEVVAPEVAVPAPETAVPIPETPGVPEEGAKVPGLETPEQVPEERVQGPETLAASEKKSAKAYQIELIEGIGTMYGEKMAAAGVFTTGDLLDTAASRKGRDDLVRRTGISGKLILEWVNRADLMRVPGIGEEYSDLLEAAGVDTVKELRRRKPESLLAKMSKANEKKNLVRRLPSEAEVTAWVEAAKELEPLVTY